jgi:hypothetical protein
MLLGTIAGLLGPPALSRVLSWPMLLGLWLGTPRVSAPRAGPLVFLEGPATGPLAFALGVAFTWLCYVLLVRVMLWRIAVGRAERVGSSGRS